MENTSIVNTTPAVSVTAHPAHVEVVAPVLEVAAEVAAPAKAKRVRAAKVEVAAVEAAPVKTKRKTPVAKVVVEAASAEESIATRIYTKRVRKFDLKTQNQIVQRVKQVGVVQTANEFNSLYIYISKVCKSRRMKIKLGRRGNVAA